MEDLYVEKYNPFHSLFKNKWYKLNETQLEKINV